MIYFSIIPQQALFFENQLFQNQQQYHQMQQQNSIVNNGLGNQNNGTANNNRSLQTQFWLQNSQGLYGLNNGSQSRVIFILLLLIYNLFYLLKFLFLS